MDSLSPFLQGSFIPCFMPVYPGAPQHSTGPRTEEGKAASSRNRLTFGLFTQRDFIAPGEEEEHSRLAAALWAQLKPETPMEEVWATAIVSATWRMRRCSLVEDNMSDYIGGDPMENGFGQKMQTPVDRARSSAFNRLQRASAELRRLQTDRALARHLATDQAPPSEGLASPTQLVTTLTHAKRAKLLAFQPDTKDLASNCNPPKSPTRDVPIPQKAA